MKLNLYTVCIYIYIYIFFFFLIDVMEILLHMKWIGRLKYVKNTLSYTLEQHNTELEKVEVN